DVTLLSLSASDYTHLAELMSSMANEHQNNHVVFSFPSLRADSLSKEVMNVLKGVRKSGFTIAIEAGSERLRRVINKGINESEIIRMVHQIFSNGWNIIKLYFMIGLPTETDDDLCEIVRLVNELKSMMKRLRVKRGGLNLAISTIVPKSHTPFQWMAQDSIGVIKEKQRFLKSRLSARMLNVKSHSPSLSHLEAVLSRGDRALGAVIEHVWQLGARFDQWGDYFDFNLWQRAFKDFEIDPAFYANRERDLDEDLPWDHLHVGVEKSFLKEEYQRALSAQETSGCQDSTCQRCGICNNQIKIVRSTSAGEIEKFIQKDTTQRVRVQRLRCKYRLFGPMVFLSHLDLIRTFIRIFRRAELPVVYTQGFHPHPKISFGPALPVGMGGAAEYLDMDMYEMSNSEHVLEKINAHMPYGLLMVEITSIPLNAPSLSMVINQGLYRLTVPPESLEDTSVTQFQSLADMVMNQDQILYIRERKNTCKEIDLKPFIVKLEAYRRANGLEVDVTLRMSQEQNIKPLEVLEAIYGERLKNKTLVKQHRLNILFL
ncbi:MAG: TIGR03936 family radical SAM-associated protein, partial [bacterium]